MSVVKVGKGLFKVSLEKAIRTLEIGDELHLPEGEHYLPEALMINGITIKGIGDRDKIILKFQVTANSKCVIENLTIAPPAFYNALFAKPDSTVALKNVVLKADPTNKYPSLYAEKSQIVLENCLIEQFAENWVALEAVDSVLDIENSRIEFMKLCSSRANMANNWSKTIFLEQNSRLKSVGPLNIEAEENYWSLILKDQSVFEAQALTLDAQDPEIFCTDSYLQADSLKTKNNSSLSARHYGEGRINIVSELIKIYEADENGNILESSSRQEAYAEEPAQTQTEPQTQTQTELLTETVEKNQSGSREDSYPQPAQNQAENTSAINKETGSLAGANPDPMAEINSLIGLEKVKEQIASFLNHAQINEMRRQRGLKAQNSTLHSMFLGNPGTGKTTVARLLGKALHQGGLTRSDAFLEVGRKDLVGQHLGESAILTGEVVKNALGGILFIDEAYSLYQDNGNSFAQEAVDTLLAEMENHRDDLIVIFAGYPRQMQDLIQMNPGLESRVPHRFDFQDYTPREIATIGYRMLIDQDYLVDETQYRQVVARHYAQGNDKSNGRWIRNFNDDLLREMSQRISREISQREHSEIDLQSITDEDLATVGKTGDRDSEEKIAQLLESLDALVGLAPVKTHVRRLVVQMQAEKMLPPGLPADSKPSRHILFTGNPGTGKTTVANIVAKLFYHLGMLARPTLEVVTRADLVGKWVGHTEVKTNQVIDAAMGGVLFIDEAYQLSQDSVSDFGRKAIETLLPRLEADRDKFVVIFAGYTEQMEEFLDSNPGLRSRIPYTIEFPDYSPAEVGVIAARILASRWKIDQDFVAGQVASKYASLPAFEQANGRSARNIVEEIEYRHRQWMVQTGTGGDAALHILNEVVAGINEG